MLEHFYAGLMVYARLTDIDECIYVTQKIEDFCILIIVKKMNFVFNLLYHALHAYIYCMPY